MTNAGDGSVAPGVPESRRPSGSARPMKSLVRTSCGTIVLATMVITTPLAQEASTEAAADGRDVVALQRLATERLRHEVGTWTTRVEFLDADGQVVNEVEGTETRMFVIDDRVLQTVSTVPALDRTGVSLKFFKADAKMMYAVSTDKDGDLWTFTEEVDGHVSTSTRHDNPDGTATYLRFSTLRETEHTIDVNAEMSSDGTDWTPIFRQYAVRQR